MASNSATASFALLDCSGPIRCSARPGCADISGGHFALASWTRFSPNTRCPDAITGRIPSASNVLDTAISVTAARSRRACLHSRAISCSTAARAFGKDEVSVASVSEVMSSSGCKVLRSFEFYPIQESLLEPLSVTCRRARGPAMASVSFNRNRVKLKALLGIRARLALLALILVVLWMLERVRSLEDTRARQGAAASQEFANLAQHSADAQREVISSVEAMLKSAAYIRASAGGVGKSCLILRASLTVELPWIRSMSIVGRNGRVQCSTLNGLVGVDLSDRPYFKKMRETGGFGLSEYLFGRASKEPTIVAAYPVAAIDQDEDAFIVAAVNLDWMSLTMGNLGGRPGVSAVMVDSIGTVVAAPPDQASLIGRSLDHLPLLSAVAEQALHADKATGTVSFTAADGSKRAASFARIAGTNSRLIVSIDEAKVSAGINRDIRTAYLQLAFVCVFVLIGALIAAEKLIIQPIEVMAAMTRKFAQGDWSARVSRARLPAEFVPLARAFNAMAAHLGQRERELVATNDRLT